MPAAAGVVHDSDPNLCLDIREDREALAFRGGTREQIGNFQRLPDHSLHVHVSVCGEAAKECHPGAVGSVRAFTE
jgi:hypothetical protein